MEWIIHFAQNWKKKLEKTHHCYFRKKLNIELAKIKTSKKSKSIWLFKNMHYVFHFFIKFDKNLINFRRVGIFSNLMEWIINFEKKTEKKTRENSPLLLPHPDILRNFFRNCIRVGLSGGELVACLLVVLLLLPPGIPDCDSKEYWRDSNDACRGDAWVLKKKFVKMTIYKKNNYSDLTTFLSCEFKLRLYFKWILTRLERSLPFWKKMLKLIIMNE